MPDPSYSYRLAVHAMDLDETGHDTAVGSSWKHRVRAATTASITISTALNDGDTLDGITLVDGDRVLVKDQSTGSQNGIYIVASTPARAADFDVGADVLGAVVYVYAGTANAGKAFKNTNTTLPTIDTTALTFTEFGGASASDLDNLTDVVITSPSSGDVLIYSGSQWENDTAGSASALDDLTDVNTSGQSSGDVLTYSGSQWEPQAPSGGALIQAYVGYNTVGGSTENATSQRVYAKKVTLANDCLVTSIEAYIDQGNGDNVVAAMGAGIFTDNSGTPQYLLCHTIGQESLSIVLDTTSSGGGNTSPRWFSWAIGRWVTAGDYWIAVAAHDTKIRLYKDGSGTDRYYTASGEWMADWGFYTPTTTTDRYSIRANTIR